jgi:hypothetical protein
MDKLLRKINDLIDEHIWHMGMWILMISGTGITQNVYKVVRKPKEHTNKNCRRRNNFFK